MVLGLVMLAALGLGAAALVTVGERAGWSRPHFHVTVGFPDVAGVEVGTRVRVQGIDAGEVEAVLPPARPGEPVKLRLRIASQYHHLVGADARVQIAAENLLAGKVVRVLPGAPDANPVAEDGELAALIQPDLLDGIAQATGKLNSLLSEVDAALQAFRKQEGTSGSITRELSQATKKLNAVLARADDALAGVERGEGTLGKLVKNDELYHELTETLAQAKGALSDVRGGEGTLGKLVKNNEAYTEALSSLQDMRRMVASVKQNSDAIKNLPVVRGYVIDPHKILVRPECKRERRWFDARELFEPGKAVLTAQGRRQLDAGAEWLNAQKDEGSEVVIATFTAPGQDPDYAQTLTQKQSEAVVEYLKGQHRVQRTGWWWFSNREVRAVGCGANPSPVPETETLPASRVELIVFAPQG
jgi:phospholipid/cholesterol/gamma-HCH transport system substrate-binding protein